MKKVFHSWEEEVIRYHEGKKKKKVVHDPCEWLQLVLILERDVQYSSLALLLLFI